MSEFEHSQYVVPKIDTLKEYHIQAAHGKIRHLVENITTLLQDPGSSDHTHLLLLIEKLLVELMYIRKCYQNFALAEQLDLDIEEATYLIEQLKGSYNIDDPLSWIKRFIAQSNKTRLNSKVKNSELMRGLQAIEQAEDTAEERKLRDRKQLQPQP